MPPAPTGHRFTRKLACAAMLVLVADWLFYNKAVGATLGGFALAWVAGLVATVPAIRRRPSALALAVAAMLALFMVDDPSALAWLLCWSAIGVAVLLPRHRADDAARWGLRLLAYGAMGPFGPLRDAIRLARRGHGGGRALALGGTLALPVAGAAVFGALFAFANPVIGSALAGVQLPSLGEAVIRLLFWGAVLTLVWPSLRPRTVRLDRMIGIAGRRIDLPVATLLLSLVTFNLLFAVQNALDVAFLWSGTALPAGVTLADYAHQGAYTLIATALLAGGFVLVALAPGSPASHSLAVRQLVVLWVAQNVLLVASSILRLLDYVAAYSLTEFRIAALAWMALVAIGLVLVAVRLLLGRSAGWLVNVNALAAGIVLGAASAIDLGAVAASWNVAHARRGDQLDLCYLHRLGPSALLPLIELERRAGGPTLRDRAGAIRGKVMADLAASQSDWHRWTWRAARRLAAARSRLGANPPTPQWQRRRCDGTPLTDGVQR